MNLQLQSFSTLVQNMAAAVQSAATTMLDLSIGSVTRAIMEANASIALWLQWLIVQVMQATRASTSVGADLDSWMADFSLSRLPPSASGGTVTFSRRTTGLSAIIPSGAQVKTADGSQTFSVVQSTSLPSWSAAQGGYVLAANSASIDLPVAAIVPGSIGNIQAGAIAQLATAIPGIDTVSNQLPFTGGRDAESDAALRARFQTYIQSRSLATTLAVSNAIMSVQQGVTFAIVENADASGATRPGNFVVTINDGTGNPQPALIAAVQSAIEAVRPIGSTFTVQGPSLVQAVIQLSLTTGSASPSATTTANVVSAITAFANNLGIGAGLSVTRVAQLAYDADQSISNVTGVLINGQGQDLAVGTSSLVQLSSVSVL